MLDPEAKGPLGPLRATDGSQHGRRDLMLALGLEVDTLHVDHVEVPGGPAVPRPGADLLGVALRLDTRLQVTPKLVNLSRPSKGPVPGHNGLGHLAHRPQGPGPGVQVGLKGERRYTERARRASEEDVGRGHPHY